MVPTMEQEKQINQQSSSSNDISLNKPLRCIVKLGGAAITCKNEIEKINDENLGIASSQLRQAMNSSSSSNKVIGMDWSKRSGVSEISPSLDDFGDSPSLDSSNFIVVHGAGSFGHFQASRSGVHRGGLHLPLVIAGFVATRISVTSLNLEIVRALAREGIPSIGMSPFACGWSTCERNIASADISQVARAINSGFVPVLHGDAVLDNLQGCTILSGDVIIRHLAELLKPEYVVFLVSIYIAGEIVYECLHYKCMYGHLHKSLAKPIIVKTDVLGVYDRPPTISNAVLLREIAVDEDGSWSIVNPQIGSMKSKVEFTVAAHDTTGGMLTKISEAAMIAKLGIDVYIVKAATDHSLKALKGELKGDLPDDWLGTVIRSSR